jgi:hypothetical protein
MARERRTILRTKLETSCRKGWRTGEGIQNVGIWRLRLVARRLLTNLLKNTKKNLNISVCLINIKKSLCLGYFLPALTLVGLFFHPEHGYDIFFRNIP